ncbi:uncharacterized protein LOC122083187 [Macadamia integrifolia]|uniref:uncharacterized protein LOC122083187 n=1 Tax=Macadamia integrifolia TaxID=60698 RepID=UPI001C50187E|nr:uncharacterized protein LOC122083187 [Macadamia integrifolia]
MPAEGEKTAKKEDEKERTLNSSLTMKKMKKKKKKKSMNDSVGADESQGEVKKQKAIVEKKKKKKKRMMEEEKKGAEAEHNGKKKKRKVYDLPGQKCDPPDERDSLRIFYETLYQRLPGSEMAALWMMENGLLPLEKAKEVYKKNKQKRKQEQKVVSPMKASTSVKRNVDSVTVEKAKAPLSPAFSEKKSVVESENVSVWKKIKKSGKRKRRDDDSATSDDFVLTKKKTKKHREHESTKKIREYHLEPTTSM